MPLVYAFLLAPFGMTKFVNFLLSQVNIIGINFILHWLKERNDEF